MLGLRCVIQRQGEAAVNTRTIAIVVLVALIVILGGYSMLGTDETEGPDEATTETG